jgi:hypothetical protein
MIGFMRWIGSYFEIKCGERKSKEITDMIIKIVFVVDLDYE